MCFTAVTGAIVGGRRGVRGAGCGVRVASCEVRGGGPLIADFGFRISDWKRREQRLLNSEVGMRNSEKKTGCE